MCRGLCDEASAVALAIFFHDYVYDARAKLPGKNEDDSAEVFLRFAAASAPRLARARAGAIAAWIVDTGPVGRPLSTRSAPRGRDQVRGGRRR